jgi:hypothetical protein
VQHAVQLFVHWDGHEQRESIQSSLGLIGTDAVENAIVSLF